MLSEDLRPNEYWLNIVKDIMIDTKVPDRYNINEYDRFDSFTNRRIYCHLCSWALISNNFVDSLSEFLKDKKVLSLYSGRGLLEYFLRQKEIEVICTDNGSWYDPEEEEVIEYRKYLQEYSGILVENQRKKFIKDIEILDAVEAVEKYVKDIDYILASWVPFEDDEIVKVLTTMRDLNPNCRMIWIGEEDFGCNGCDEFFDIVKSEDSYDIDRINDNFQRWYGIYDYVQIYK